MKWRIKGIAVNNSFSEASFRIIFRRTKELIKIIRSLFIENSEENLHQMRIALRRLRYALEVFYICFDKKVFNDFYMRIAELQEFSGKIRDLDIVFLNYYLFNDNNDKKTSVFINKITEAKKILMEELRIKLMKFIHGTELKNFRNELNKRR